LSEIIGKSSWPAKLIRGAWNSNEGKVTGSWKIQSYQFMKITIIMSLHFSCMSSWAKVLSEKKRITSVVLMIIYNKVVKLFVKISVLLERGSILWCRYKENTAFDELICKLYNNWVSQIYSYLQNYSKNINYINKGSFRELLTIYFSPKYLSAKPSKHFGTCLFPPSIRYQYFLIETRAIINHANYITLDRFFILFLRRKMLKTI
jgi:hypothetical protein